MKRWLDVAADLGSPAIRIFAGDAQKGQPEAEARRHCVECDRGLRRPRGDAAASSSPSRTTAGWWPSPTASSRS